MTEPTNEELVKRLRRGDRTALRELVSRWEGPVFRIAWRMLGNAADAEEVRQAVFLQLLVSPGRLPDPQRFAGWIRRCTVNAAVTAIRKTKARPASGLPPDLVDETALPDRQAADSEEALRLREALQTFLPQERALLSLRFDEGLSFTQIGEALGRPASTVKSQYARLIGRLRMLLVGAVERSEPSEETDRYV
jgi:RNA polymerase sigma-70 factor, ECF subfamily